MTRIPARKLSEARAIYHSENEIRVLAAAGPEGARLTKNSEIAPRAPDAGHDDQNYEGLSARPFERRTLLATIATGLLAMTAESASAGSVSQEPQATSGAAARPNSPAPLLVSFAAGDKGRWVVDRIETVIGPSLPLAARLEVIEGRDASGDQAQAWTLRGSTSNTRYTTREEATAMSARQEGLNRPGATRAALIPIRKSEAWWTLAQDERRAIFEEQSRHIGIGIEYLPAIARRLHHSRELGEPFYFLTWFEYAPEHSAEFEKLVARLRSTPEWRYVDREVDIRLSRV